MDRPSGDDITYFYDARGAMTLLKEGASNRAVYSYDDAGAVTNTLLGNGSYTEYLFDGVGRLTLLSNKKSDTSVISSFAYALDPTGNRTKMSIAGSAYTSADIVYTYDDAYQLTGEVRTGGNAYFQVFYYDSSGNRTKKTLDATDTVYVYNEADQLTSETTGQTTTTYLYDANGALTKSDDGTNVAAYEYNYEGMLVTYEKGETNASYTYDADGRRVGKTVDGTITKFFYDANDAIADYDSNDTLIATYLTPFLDRNVSATRSGSTYYYMADGLGSIRNLIDSNETTQNVYDYYAFGKELGSWTENITNRYTYTAREYDSESQQYYYRARYYTGGGRFLSRDSVLDGFGLYLYGRNAPAGITDPSGHKVRLTVAQCDVRATLQICIFPDNSNTTWPALVMSSVASTIAGDIETYWNGEEVGCCHVQFKAYVIPYNFESDIPESCDNKVKIYNHPMVPTGPYPGERQGWVNSSGNYGEWSGVPLTRKLYPHEAGHLMGLGDEYDDVENPKTGKTDSIPWPAHKGHLMATGFKRQYHEVYDVLLLHNVFEEKTRWTPGDRHTPPHWERYVPPDNPCCNVAAPEVHNWERDFPDLLSP